jgi:hypothetical protein
MSIAKRKSLAFVAEISEAELALRILAISMGARPPPGKSAVQLLDEVKYGMPFSSTPISMGPIYLTSQTFRARQIIFG